ncbi:MAG: tRNA guanosine(15) transglycosylase TgtA [Candidatus Bathyarchaeota archaeon]
MSFEILGRDLAGRVGKLETRRGAVETPLFLPVVSPMLQPISPEEMRRDFGCQAIIANAYLLKKNYSTEIVTRGIHDFLKFDGTIVTDSGGYQILVYGDVDVSPEEIIRFQEEIGTDVAVILDIPTGWNASREKAEYTVDETLKRAKAALPLMTRKDLMWIGPVQGGNHLDLVDRSAKEIGELPFDIYALGSPTQVVEHYLFDVLVDMIVTAKRCLPVEKPFHLFGAGHPFMLSFAVATGCDIFDSAAYAIYARRGKYMTNYGTISLKDLRYFPCSCKVCAGYTPQELLEVPSEERERLLAWHNLKVCYTEVKRIKQAINDGRLWELLELRARSHPSLLQALKRLGKYLNYLEIGTSISKGRGLLYFDSLGLVRPEITRYHDKIRRWMPPTKADILVLLSQPSSKPFHNSREYRQVLELLSKRLGRDMDKIHLCTYAVPYGLIPLELDETYPLSQFEVPFPPDVETVNYVAGEVEDYIATEEKYCVVLQPNPIFGGKIEDACKRAVKPEKLFILPREEDMWSGQAINNLVGMVHAAFKTLNDPLV